MFWNWNLRSLSIARAAAVAFLALGGLTAHAQEPGWIQDDLVAALKQAKQSGNPVFIVFR